ncbi:dTDP-glucose 4,6-dehydratase [bacterium]|nr:dTDP-glucose 4,6-dehydratase [bacterium]
MRTLVTGGAGFIGCNYVRQLLAGDPDCQVRIIDKLTYAGSRDNLQDVLDDPRCEFVAGDICDPGAVAAALDDVQIVVHFAAETHVDRSIHSAEAALRTNVEGTFRLLEASRDRELHRFIHVATDEVYGSSAGECFTEGSALKPRNPYSASKAGGDRLAYSYFVTYGVPVIITRPTNTYGPYQYPEKLIPFFVLRALRDEHLPVYGDGRQVRDWLHVGDHCRAVDLLLKQGAVGEVYNIVGGNQRENMQVVRLILDELGKPESLIKHVTDRPGHDVRYHLDGTKLAGLGWQPTVPWETGMRETIRWFAEHRDWLERSLQRGHDFMEQWYRER